MRISFSKIKGSLYFLVISLLLGLLDIAVKYVILNNFIYGKPVNVVGDFLRITLVLNPNTAFGISLGENFPYALVSTILAVIVLILMFVEKDGWIRLMYALILGGAIGNITDRILNGAVVDFIDVGIGNLRWPTFNIADTFVSLGIIGILMKSLFGKNESVHSDGGVRERACNSGEGNN